MKKTVAILALLGHSAFAGSLGGRTLSCKADSQQYGNIETTYLFAAGGEERVFETSSEFGTQVDTYRDPDLKILIVKPDNAVAYELVAQNVYSGSYYICTNPGVPDGNSRPFCEHITDVCTLK